MGTWDEARGCAPGAPRWSPRPVPWAPLSRGLTGLPRCVHLGEPPVPAPAARAAPARRNPGIALSPRPFPCGAAQSPVSLLPGVNVPPAAPSVLTAGAEGLRLRAGPMAASPGGTWGWRGGWLLRPYIQARGGSAARRVGSPEALVLQRFTYFPTSRFGVKDRSTPEHSFSGPRMGWVGPSHRSQLQESFTRGFPTRRHSGSFPRRQDAAVLRLLTESLQSPAAAKFSKKPLSPSTCGSVRAVSAPAPRPPGARVKQRSWCPSR